MAGRIWVGKGGELGGRVLAIGIGRALAPLGASPTEIRMESPFFGLRIENPRYSTKDSNAQHCGGGGSFPPCG